MTTEVVAGPAPPTTAARIIEAATAEFFEYGYHGASLRRLADAAGIRSATLYYHFANKEQLLVAIMRYTLERLTEVVTAAIARAEPDALEQVSAAVRTHIRYHVERHREVFLCDAELRALGPEARAEIVARRDAYEAVFRDLLGRAAQSGALDVFDVALVTRSLLTSCSGVAFWFNPAGPMTLDTVAEGYVTLFRRALGA